MLAKELAALKSKQATPASDADSEVVLVLRGQVQQLGEELAALQQAYDQLHATYSDTEQSLVDAKVWWAQLDMECDELTVALHKKCSQLKQYQIRVTKLEVDLAKTKHALAPDPESDADSQSQTGGL